MTVGASILGIPRTHLSDVIGTSPGHTFKIPKTEAAWSSRIGYVPRHQWDLGSLTIPIPAEIGTRNLNLVLSGTPTYEIGQATPWSSTRGLTRGGGTARWAPSGSFAFLDDNAGGEEIMYVFETYLDYPTAGASDLWYKFHGPTSAGYRWDRDTAGKLNAYVRDSSNYVVDGIDLGLESFRAIVVAAISDSLKEANLAVVSFDGRVWSTSVDISSVSSAWANNLQFALTNGNSNRVPENISCIAAFDNVTATEAECLRVAKLMY